MKFSLTMLLAVLWILETSYGYPVSLRALTQPRALQPFGVPMARFVPPEAIQHTVEDSVGALKNCSSNFRQVASKIISYINSYVKDGLENIKGFGSDMASKVESVAKWFGDKLYEYI